MSDQFLRGRQMDFRRFMTRVTAGREEQGEGLPDRLTFTDSGGRSQEMALPASMFPTRESIRTILAGLAKGHKDLKAWRGEKEIPMGKI